MSQSMEDAKIFRFSNDFQIEKKKLKAKSFNNYNLCVLSCFQRSNLAQHDFCVKQCQTDYENYLQYKRSLRIPEKANYFYRLEFNKDDKDPQSQQLAHEYPRKVIDMEVQMQSHLANLKNYLNEMEKKYNDNLKKK